MKSSLLVITTMLSSALTIQAIAAPSSNDAPNATAPAAAATTATSATASQSPNYDQLYQLASQMLGHVGMANAALSYGLYGEASDSIAQAQKEAASLSAQTAQFNAANARFGKMSYKTAGGQQADYLIPVMDNNVAVREVNARRLSSTNPKMDIADAQTVNYKLFIDTKQAENAICQAQADMGQKQYDQAMAALQGITTGAVMETTAVETPLEVVRDNLALAKTLIANKEYKSASYALSHAKTELSREEKANPQSANDADEKDLQNQISDLQATLAQDNPSLLQTAEQRIDGWIKHVESYMHKKS